jgi:3-oxoacyl-[acyl-carrier protein] reductase
MGPIESISLTEWKRAIDINLFGVVLPCRSIIPHFKTNKSGKIIIISGGGATNPMPNISAYAASKAAVVRLTETISEELRGFGIDVNALAPGPMLTRLTEIVLNAGPETVGEEFFNRNKKWKEEGIDSSYQAADLAIYLIGSQSNGITGKLISAKWDNWNELDKHVEELKNSDIYCLRRIIPIDRNKDWS